MEKPYSPLGNERSLSRILRNKFKSFDKILNLCPDSVFLHHNCQKTPGLGAAHHSYTKYVNKSSFVT